MPTEDLLTKEESAELIGCSVRSFEQYKTQGLVTHAEMRKGKRGQQAVYRRSDVEALKRLLAERRNDSKSGILASQRREEDTSLQNERMLVALEVIASALPKTPQLPAAGSADKFLTVKEAAEQFGLSESHVRKAHKEEKLNIYHLPSVRGDRVSENEVKTYIASMDLTEFIKPRTKKQPRAKAKAAKARSR